MAHTPPLDPSLPVHFCSHHIDWREAADVNRSVCWGLVLCMLITISDYKLKPKDEAGFSLPHSSLLEPVCPCSTLILSPVGRTCLWPSATMNQPVLAPHQMPGGEDFVQVGQSFLEAAQWFKSLLAFPRKFWLHVGHWLLSLAHLACFALFQVI